MCLHPPILPHYAFTEESYLLQKIIESALPYLPKFTYDQLRSIAEMWMEETHLEEMKEVMPRSVGVADLYQAMKDLARFAFFFTILAEYLYLTEVMVRFTQMEYRLGYGIRSELIPLVTAFPHLSRARARQFYQTGYTSPETLQTESIEEIAQKTHLPLTLIQSLHEIKAQD